MHIDITELLFNLVGGLGLFLYGMRMMSEGLQKAAGDKLRAIFNLVTTNRFAGLFTGFAVTATIQSSSATTVMLVGFVNSGLMSLQQAVNVILGANIGTTFTGWLFAFKITEYGLPLIGAGVVLTLFSHRPVLRYVGETLLGLGLLFFGLELMKHGFSPLRDEPAFHRFFLLFGADNIFQIIMSVAAGCILTMVVQSSSATLGITMGLASQGLLTFPAAAALILGENIGTTVTALLSSIGTTVNARRAAWAHTLFNTIGVTYLIILFPFYIRMVDSVVPGAADMVLANGTKPYIMAHMAASHTIFNVMNVLVFLPFTGVLARVVTRIVRDKKAEPGDEDDRRGAFLHYDAHGIPGLMIAESRRETERMYDIATVMFAQSRDFLLYPEKRTAELRRTSKEMEKNVDAMQADIVKFLSMVNRRGGLSAEDIKEARIHTRVVDETESIGDYCGRLTKLAFAKTDENITFSEEAMKDLAEIYEEMLAFMSRAKECFLERKPEIAEDCEVRRKHLNKMIKAARAAHIDRLQQGTCDVMPALHFNNFLNNLRRLRSHVTNIVEASMGEK